LAWRLRATFLFLVIDDESEAPRQAIMRRIGRIVDRVLFRRTTLSGQSTSGESVDAD
jgi:hypothetical protein